MNAALWFLVLRSFIGGTRHKLTRLKQPKYLFPTLFSVLYFGGITIPHLLGRHGVREGVAFFVPMGVGYLAISLASMWLFQPQRLGLNLTEAEAEMLLAAPLTKRQVLDYYIFKAQPGIVFLALVLSLFFPVVMGMSSRPILFVSLVLLINALRMFGLLVSFLWPALAGSFWHWPLRIGGAILLLASGYASVLATWGEGVEVLDFYLFRLQGAWADLLALPVRSAIASGFAANVTEALPGWSIMGLFCATTWFLTPRLNVAFEENALNQAQRRTERLARRRGQRGMSKPHKERKRVWLPLAPTGPPWLGLVWKNAMRLFRSEFGMVLGGLVAVLILVLAYLLITGAGAGLVMFGTMTAPLALMSGLILPNLLRTDFRGEMEQMELVKTLPISARQMMAVMVGFTTLLTVAFQLLLLAISLIAAAFSEAPPEYLLLIALCAVIVLPTLTYSLVMLENCLVLWFPAWFAFQAAGRGRGFDYMGRRLISMFGRLLGTGLLGLIPGGVGAAIGIFGTLTIGVWSWAIAALVGAVLLIVEVTLLGGNVATLYERLEPGSAELS